MNLRERLRLMRPAATAASRSEPVWSPEQETPREPPAALARVPALPPQDGAEQRWVATPLGPALCLERAYLLDHRQGRVPLTTCLDVPRRGWQRLLSRALPANFDPARTVFLDLETTGLGRGTGTYAFLVGIGRFLGDHFVVRQYFMRSYPDEPAVLAAVQAELEDAAGLITFNGRSFDWPLLETRATLNRMRLPLLPHLDLLHPARRVWRPITDSCRLGDLEATVLGHWRHDDVPGALIPQLYFNYLQSGDAAPLAGVFEHNRLDIVSMACMAGYLGHAAAAPLSARPAGTPLSGAELYSMARLLLDQRPALHSPADRSLADRSPADSSPADRGPADQGSLTEAIACLEEALARGLPHGLRREAYRLLAIAHRRQWRTSRAEPPAAERAVAVLQAWIREDGLSTWPYVELAKHCEHRIRDLEAARHWTLKAIELAQRRRTLRGLAAGRGTKAAVPAPSDRELDELLHRLRRIESKLAARSGRFSGQAAGHGRD